MQTALDNQGVYRAMFATRLEILREDLQARLMFVGSELVRPWFEAEANSLLVIARAWDLEEYAAAAIHEMRETLN